MAKEIPLTKDKFAIVDDEDYEFLSQWKWYYGNYAKRRVTTGFYKSKIIPMHRIINQTPEGMETDHINGNKLDNRRCNLRTVTKGQNNINRPAYKGSTSEFKGVYWCKLKQKWKAQIAANKKNKALGYYNTEVEAAEAYNKAAKIIHGNQVKLNITGSADV